MRKFIVGVVVAIVLAPCLIAMFREVERHDDASDWNVLEEGFV